MGGEVQEVRLGALEGGHPLGHGPGHLHLLGLRGEELGGKAPLLPDQARGHRRDLGDPDVLIGESGRAGCVIGDQRPQPVFAGPPGHGKGVLGTEEVQPGAVLRDLGSRLLQVGSVRSHLMS